MLPGSALPTCRVERACEVLPFDIRRPSACRCSRKDGLLEMAAPATICCKHEEGGRHPQTSAADNGEWQDSSVTPEARVQFSVRPGMVA